VKDGVTEAIEDIEEIGADDRDADGTVGAEATSGSGTGPPTGTIGSAGEA
jgi:hypothetical protein